MHAAPQERRVALAEGRPVAQDLLGVLLTAADEAGQKMTDEELWEDVHDVMGAGGCALGTYVEVKVNTQPVWNPSLLPHWHVIMCMT
jgi:hypothetical protein